MIKLTVLYNHPKSSDDFERYYAETHMPIAAKITGYERLELTKFAPGADGAAPSHYRMAEFWFQDEAQMGAVMGSAEAQAAVADLENFATGGVSVLVGPVQVV